MKVLHVIPSVGPLRGGPSSALLAITRSLAKAGIQVHVATTDDNGLGRLEVPLHHPVTCDGVTTWYFPRQTRFYTFSWPLTRWLARHVHEYDLVHIHALFSHASLSAALLATRFRVPYIVRPLGTLNRWGMRHRRRWLKLASFRLIERRILARAAAVHYTSHQERLEASELSIRSVPVVVPIGIDLAERDRLAPSDHFLMAYPALANRTIILFLSRLDKKKGLELLLSAFASAREVYPDAALVIAGSGEQSYAAELHGLAQHLGIADSVVWPGFLSGDAKAGALSAASIFALPSYSENFGIAPAEAMAAGLPVVLTHHVGMATEVEQAQAGLVVPSEVETFSAALQRLLSDPSLRRQLGANGRRLAHDRFSSEATTPQLIAMYHQVLRRQIGGESN
jgi:glycosyltransferase involved in cell wall biosynthesis